MDYVRHIHNCFATFSNGFNFHNLIKLSSNKTLQIYRKAHKSIIYDDCLPSLPEYVSIPAFTTAGHKVGVVNNHDTNVET